MTFNLQGQVSRRERTHLMNGVELKTFFFLSQEGSDDDECDVQSFLFFSCEDVADGVQSERCVFSDISGSKGIQ